MAVAAAVTRRRCGLCMHVINADYIQAGCSRGSCDRLPGFPVAGELVSSGAHILRECQLQANYPAGPVPTGSGPDARAATSHRPKSKSWPGHGLDLRPGPGRQPGRTRAVRGGIRVKPRRCLAGVRATTCENAPCGQGRRATMPRCHPLSGRGTSALGAAAPWALLGAAPGPRAPRGDRGRVSVLLRPRRSLPRPAGSAAAARAGARFRRLPVPDHRRRRRLARNRSDCRATLACQCHRRSPGAGVEARPSYQHVGPAPAPR